MIRTYYKFLGSHRQKLWMIRIALFLPFLSLLNNDFSTSVYGWQNVFNQFSKPQSSSSKNKVALVTGGTGRTGQICVKLLLEQGYTCRIFARDCVKAEKRISNSLKQEGSSDFSYNPRKTQLEFIQGDLGNATSIQAAFTTSPHKKPITHVVYTAGGEDADYDAVSYRGVREFAKQAAAVPGQGLESFVVISTAWASKPYSIASLLFNTLYTSIPMACYYMGEQELRRYAAGDEDGNGGFHYVILRPGGLNTDENYVQKYPEASQDLRLTYQQGDKFEFLGPAGRPGMCRTQLANAVVTALDAQGQYTVEVTGSGTIDMKDSTIYETGIMMDDKLSLPSPISNDDIMKIHSQAVVEMKTTALIASLSGILLIVAVGWLPGIFGLLTIDVLIVFIWSQLFANRQI